jgi:hypothetical protein
VRLAIAVVFLAALATTVTAGPASAATRECDGLMVCVPIAGPWVVVPASTSVPRPAVEFQLSCPRGYVVGGLDAELTDRALDVTFVATLGSPVNPGITTSRAAVFVATYTGTGASGARTFRPHVGCLPATGGGGRVPTSASAVFQPGKPTIRRVRDVRLHAGSFVASQSCASGERLVGAAHAVGFFTTAPPTAALLTSVTAKRVLAATGVRVAIKATAAAARVRSIVQVSAICAGGR